MASCRVQGARIGHRAFFSSLLMLQDVIVFLKTIICWVIREGLLLTGRVRSKPTTNKLTDADEQLHRRVRRCCAAIRVITSPHGSSRTISSPPTNGKSSSIHASTYSFHRRRTSDFHSVQSPAYTQMGPGELRQPMCLLDECTISHRT